MNSLMTLNGWGDEFEDDHDYDPAEDFPGDDDEPFEDDDWDDQLRSLGFVSAHLTAFLKIVVKCSGAQQIDCGYRICPEPIPIYLYVVNSSNPIGPRACSLSVLIPISTPIPNSAPSVKRVDAFT